MANDWTFPVASRYFECVVPALNTEKFWCYALKGIEGGITVESYWGRIGSKGQMDTKLFNSESRAVEFVEGKTTEKLRKGYVERDVAWVKRLWSSWRPPHAVDGKASPIRPSPAVDDSSRFMRRAVPRVAVNPGRLKPREPVPARAAKRVIDLTEE